MCPRLGSFCWWGRAWMRGWVWRADKDQNFPLRKGHLVPPLLLGLPNGSASLKPEHSDGSGGECHKSGDVALLGVAVRGGEDEGGGECVRMGWLVLLTRAGHNNWPRAIAKRSSKGWAIRFGSSLRSFGKRAPAKRSNFEGLDRYLWGTAGSRRRCSTSVTLKTGSQLCGSLFVPGSKTFCTLSHAEVQCLEDRAPFWKMQPHSSTKLTAIGGGTRSGFGEGLAMAYEGRGVVLKGWSALIKGGGLAIPRYQVRNFD